MLTSNIEKLGQAKGLLHRTFRREIRRRLFLIVQECTDEGFSKAYVLRQIGEELIQIANESSGDADD